MLHYPTAMYFFVNRPRPELAAEIRRGLKISLKDGLFDTPCSCGSSARH